VFLIKSSLLMLYREQSVSDVNKIYIHTLSVSAAEPGAHSMKWVKKC